MNQLFMGSIGRKKAFTFEAKDLKHHMFISGQSGSGKSSVVGRLVEEIVLRDAGHVLLFDCNCEFMQFADIDENSFGKPYNCRNSPEDTLAEFECAWGAKKSGIMTVKADDINILYPDIPTDSKAQLLGINQEKHAGAYWLMQLVDEDARLRNRIIGKGELRKLSAHVERWCEGRATRDEAQELGPLVDDIRRHMSALDLTRFANGVRSIENQPYINFDLSRAGVLNDLLVTRLFENLSFLGIDLLNFAYEHYDIRRFVVFYLLLLVWKVAQSRFKKKDTTLFIVIDEAHNLAPSTVDSTQSLFGQGVSGIIRTIAAEGRKFGLFLILISQRPDKIDQSVLSECDNFVVMKSIPPIIERISDIMSLSSSDKTELAKASKFETGKAFYCGAFTASELVPVDGDIKRTL